MLKKSDKIKLERISEALAEADATFQIALMYERGGNHSLAKEYLQHAVKSEQRAEKLAA